MYFHSVHQPSLEDVQTLSRSRWQAIEFIFVFSFQKTHTPTQTVLQKDVWQSETCLNSCTLTTFDWGNYTLILKFQFS